jgi:pimeloyl-ACP methyl ester carboxylesterase
MSSGQKENVIILHGIGMIPLRMGWIERGLKKAGYETHNLSYPSLECTIEECAQIAAQKIRARNTGSPGSTHLVTHSMGSLVALELLQQNLLSGVHRAVMIAPPFGGSEVADFLAQNPIYRRAFGPAGQQLTTSHRRTLPFNPPKDVEIGVIAGTSAWEHPFFLPIMKKTGAHDGLVSLESTRIPGMKAHITIRMPHSFLLEKSVPETVHFLHHGRFKSDSGTPPPSKAHKFSAD